MAYAARLLLVPPGTARRPDRPPERADGAVRRGADGRRHPLPRRLRPPRGLHLELLHLRLEHGDRQGPVLGLRPRRPVRDRGRPPLPRPGAGARRLEGRRRPGRGLPGPALRRPRLPGLARSASPSRCRGDARSEPRAAARRPLAAGARPARPAAHRRGLAGGALGRPRDAGAGDRGLPAAPGRGPDRVGRAPRRLPPACGSCWASATACTTSRSSSSPTTYVDRPRSGCRCAVPSRRSPPTVSPRDRWCCTRSGWPSGCTRPGTARAAAACSSPGRPATCCTAPTAAATSSPAPTRR